MLSILSVVKESLGLIVIFGLHGEHTFWEQDPETVSKVGKF
jgi:hypothetical protein